MKKTKEPYMIVAQITRNWRTDPADERLICERFEEVIFVNLDRGYKLDSWKFASVHIPESPGSHAGGGVETIIAVFVRV